MCSHMLSGNLCPAECKVNTRMQENTKKPSVKPRIFSSGVKISVSGKMGTQHSFIGYAMLLLIFRHVVMPGMSLILA